MNRDQIGHDWADGPWKHSNTNRKPPFIQREVWGWIAVGFSALFIASVTVHMWNVTIDAQINGDPQEVVE